MGRLAKVGHANVLMAQESLIPLLAITTLRPQTTQPISFAVRCSNLSSCIVLPCVHLRG